MAIDYVDRCQDGSGQYSGIGPIQRWFSLSEIARKKLSGMSPNNCVEDAITNVTIVTSNMPDITLIRIVLFFFSSASRAGGIWHGPYEGE
jgi:hypothetical protein